MDQHGTITWRTTKQSKTHLCIYSIIARRHGHVFRMALHNDGDWWMQTMTTSPSMWVVMSPNANPHTLQCEQKPNTHLLNPSIARYFMEGQMQAKQADVCSGVLFWTAYTRHCHLAVKNPIMAAGGSVKTATNHERWQNTEASKGWVFIVHFSIYSISRSSCHARTDIPSLRGRTLQISQVVRSVRHWISDTSEMWWANAKLAN